jgi:hypothetical protein
MRSCWRGLEFLRVNATVIPARPGFARFFAALGAGRGARWLVSDVRPRSGALATAGAWLDKSLLATVFALN